jgi:hypothetical protein
MTITCYTEYKEPVGATTAKNIIISSNICKQQLQEVSLAESTTGSITVTEGATKTHKDNNN